MSQTKNEQSQARVFKKRTAVIACKEEILSQIDPSLPDSELLADYLNLSMLNSHCSYRYHKSVLSEQFYRVVGKPIVEMTYIDLDNVAHRLECSKYAKGVKMGYWSTIKSYYEWSLDRLRKKGIMVTNNLPLRVRFGSSQHDVDLDAEREDHSEILSDSQMAEIEERAKLRGLKWLVMFLFLKHCGMRCSELITIRLKNVHLAERYVITGLENGARKGKKPLLFFIHEKLVPKLQQYLMTLPPETEWLFPTVSKLNLSGHLERGAVYDQLGLHVHHFRKTLTTRRIDNGCPPHIAELLMNRAISSVQFKHYYKKSREEKREFFDKYHPY